jgi:hypothetical protein
MQSPEWQAGFQAHSDRAMAYHEREGDQDRGVLHTLCDCCHVTGAHGLAHLLLMVTDGPSQ